MLCALTIGCGMAAKLVNQALVGVHAQAACEALSLAQSLGRDQ
jgi:3-hydroxyisobutyrate dehydrogenase-like beta-hydroxyacid dehydrogenase